MAEGRMAKFYLKLALYTQRHQPRTALVLRSLGSPETAVDGPIAEE
jgi:hypothetical protein